jgi:hypothetical protein
MKRQVNEKFKSQNSKFSGAVGFATETLQALLQKLPISQAFPAFATFQTCCIIL